MAAIRRLDELQQRLHLIAIAISFAATGALVAMNKFLLLAFGWSPSGLELWMVMMLVWGVGIAALTHRYR